MFTKVPSARQACRGRHLGELLGECITKQAEILHRFAELLASSRPR